MRPQATSHFLATTSVYCSLKWSLGQTAQQFVATFWHKTLAERHTQHHKQPQLRLRHRNGLVLASLAGLHLDTTPAVHPACLCLFVCRPDHTCCTAGQARAGASPGAAAERPAGTASRLPPAARHVAGSTHEAAGGQEAVGKEAPALSVAAGRH